MTLPLMSAYPRLEAAHRLELCSLPTPVTPLPGIASRGGVRSVWAKRDDVTGAEYGGNKLRKLEFLMGEAVAAGATDVITFGAAGSNHALATAIVGRRLNLKVHSILMPQPNARYVRRNLLASIAAGADLHAVADRDDAMRTAVTLRTRLREVTGHEPFVVPFGGTTPSSTAGFVNAAFELAGQVREGLFPEPDLVFCALGSMGTAAGLALGLRAAGLRSRLVAVPVVSDAPEVDEALLREIVAAQAHVCSLDASFPEFAWRGEEYDVAHGYLGAEYARFTPAGMDAVNAAAADDLKLEGTYTGKTMSALLDMQSQGLLEGMDVLFWNTYNGRDLAEYAGETSVDDVPEALRSYFETDVQGLDREVQAC